MQPVITVKNLTKTYTTYKQGFGLDSSIKDFFRREHKQVHALENVSFDIGRGEIVGLIGPNGAGKSTTLKILSGILFPSSGEVKIVAGEKTFIPWKNRTEYVKNIGVLFGQKSRLWFDLPAIDTFQLNKVLYDIPEKDFERRLAKFVKLLEIEEVIKRPVRQLSLGERMKSELVASLLHAPALVFLDEPTIGLDILVKERIREAIKKINKDEKMTVILTTHDLQDIDKLCKRVIILNEGAMVYDGALETLKSRYIQEKNIHAIFENPVGKFSISGAIVDSVSQNEVSLRVAKSKVGDLTHRLLAKHSLKDITISEPSIEQVIGHIYNKDKEKRSIKND